MEQRPLPSIPNINEASLLEDTDSTDKIQVYRTNSGKEHCLYHPRVVLRAEGPPRGGAVCKPVAGPQVPSTAVPATPTGSTASGSGGGIHGAVGGPCIKAMPPGGGAIVKATPPMGGACVKAMPSSSVGAVAQPAGAGPPTASAACAAPVRAGSSTAPGSGTATPASCKDDHQYFVLDPDQENEARRRHGPQADQATGGGPHKSPEEENAENINKEVHINSCHEIPLRPSREGSQIRTDNSNSTSNSSWP